MNSLKRNYFSMTEIVLALIVVVAGIVVIMGLMPVGMKAHSEAMAQSNAADSAEQFLHYVRSEVRADWAFINAFPDSKPGPNDGPLLDGGVGVAAASAADMIWSSDDLLPGAAAKISFSAMNLDDDWDPEFHTSGVFRVQQMTGEKVDFSAGMLAWKTGAAYNDDADEAMSFFINVEVSWPITVDYAARDQAMFMIEVFKPQRTDMAQFTGGKICTMIDLAAGTSIEGQGVIDEALIVTASTATGVALLQGQEPFLFTAPNSGNSTETGCGNAATFGDASESEANRANDFTFSFANSGTVSLFSMRMLDYGDYNPAGATSHGVSLVAYDASGTIVDKSTLSYTSSADLLPGDGGGAPGDLQIAGDACSAAPGDPGNYTFVVAGAGIASASLEFSHNGDASYQVSDPAIAFADICFTLESTSEDDPDDPDDPDVDDTYVVGFVEARSAGGEGVGSASFALEVRSLGNGNGGVAAAAAPGSDISVDYVVTGTATAGLDYTLAAGTVAVPLLGSAITALIIDDTLVEESETIVVTLTNPANADLGEIPTHTHTILDDDSDDPEAELPTVSFLVSASANAESVTNPILTVVLSAASTDAVTVGYSHTGGTATAGGDFTMASSGVSAASVGAISFAPGETTMFIPLTIIDDLDIEEDETIQITLVSPVNATLGTTPVHTYGVLDNDNCTDVLGGGDLNINPANSDGNIFSYTTDSGNTDMIDMKDYFHANGNTNMSYSGPASQVQVMVKATGRTMTINGESVTLDTNKRYTFSGDMTINLRNTKPSPRSWGAAHGHWWISLTGADICYTSADAPAPAYPDISFTAAAANGAESAGSANIQVELSSVQGSAVQVDYTVTGTATGSGVDYSLQSGTLFLPAGTLTASLSLPIVNDAAEESAETVVLTLSNPVETFLGTNAVLTFTIEDDDGVAPPIPPTVPIGSTVAGEVNLNYGSNAAVAFTMVTPTGTITQSTLKSGGGGYSYNGSASSVTFRPRSADRTLTIDGAATNLSTSTTYTITGDLTVNLHNTDGSSKWKTNRSRWYIDLSGTGLSIMPTP